MVDIADVVRGGDLRRLRAVLEETNPLDIAEEIARLEPPERAVAFRLLDKDRALAVFEALDPTHQQELLEGLREQQIQRLIEEMDPDDRVRLLDEMPAKVARRLQAGLSPRERQLTSILLGYPDESAGRIMTPEYVNLRAAMTAGDGLAKIRRSDVPGESLYSLPVTDDERRLVGLVKLDQLVIADPGARVSDLMQSNPPFVRVQDDQEEAVRLIQEADQYALPVVDTEDRLVGVITIDDAFDVMEEEHSEDIARTGASEPLGRPYLSATAFFLARKRALWLLVLIVAAALTVNVLQYFEDTLEAIVTLALFIPLLIGTGGNAGAQAATVVVRAMAIGEVRFVDLPKIIWREARVGLLLGVMLGAAGFLPVAMLVDPDIATVISLTLVGICTWASFVGSLLPMLAKRVGIDPAVVSAPLVATLVDATGLIIYFVIARAVLAGQLA